MPFPVKESTEYGETNHFRRNACVKCGASLQVGRPQGTTHDNGFSVSHSDDRPSGTTRKAGSNVSDGRPRGTTREGGCSVSDGQPCGTIREAGCNVSDRRLCGTTHEAGSNVGDGRPRGTTLEAGSHVSSGQPCGRRNRIEFHDSIEFPTEWHGILRKN